MMQGIELYMSCIIQKCVYFTGANDQPQFLFCLVSINEIISSLESNPIEFSITIPPKLGSVERWHIVTYCESP